MSKRWAAASTPAALVAGLLLGVTAEEVVGLTDLASRLAESLIGDR